MDLNDSAFGKIRVREILGAEPGLDALDRMLGEEIGLLVRGLEGRSPEELVRLRESQARIMRDIDSRPGAMALPQSKIRLFEQYCSRYLAAIDGRLGP